MTCPTQSWPVMQADELTERVRLLEILLANLNLQLGNALERISMLEQLPASNLFAPPTGSNG